MGRALPLKAPLVRGVPSWPPWSWWATSSAGGSYGPRDHVRRTFVEPPIPDEVVEINYFCSVPILLQKSARDWAKPAGGAVVPPWLPRAPRERRLGRIGTDAHDAYAAHTVGSGGGLATNLASRRRFWAMAASVNSSCAARGPRKRRRPSRRMRLR